MTTDSSDATSGAVVSVARGSGRTAPALVAYGLLAAVGTVALVEGVTRYLAYADGGVNAPAPYLLSTVLVLGIGCTLCLASLSGAVAAGLQRAVE